MGTPEQAVACMTLLASLNVYKTSSPDVGGMHARDFSIFRRPAAPDGGARLLFAEVDSGKRRFDRRLWT